MDLCSLPEVVLLRLMDYLQQEDCLCLALSSKKLYNLFEQHFRYQRSLSFERCYSYTADLFTKLMGLLNPQRIRRFNVAGCSWLPGDCLLKAIHQMSDLEELLVNDTRVTLDDLRGIFPRCPNIRKLAFNFSNGKDLADEGETRRLVQLLKHDEETRTLESGFSRITSLKMMATAKSSFSAAIHILTWCVSCEDLHIEWNFGSDMCLCRDFYMDDVNSVRKLIWVQNLRSFVFIGSRGALSELFISMFMNFFYICEPPLEQVCVAINQPREYFGASILGLEGPKYLFKSLSPLSVTNLLARVSKSCEPVNLKQLSILNLRSCNVDYFDISDWQAFCLKHPNLEELHLRYRGLDFDYDDKSRLPNLKTLGIEPSASRMTRYLVSACPNVRELIVGHEKCERSLDDYEARHIIRWKKLKILRVTACGLDLGPLSLILSNCKEIECLHISSKLKDLASLYQFTFGLHQMSLPDNIRELAIRWNCEPFDYEIPSPLKCFNGSPVDEKLSLGCVLTLAAKWQHLRVLILHKEDIFFRDVHRLAERVFQLVRKSKDLRYLALIGPFKTDVVETIKQAVKCKIQSNRRPSFRLYIGPELSSKYYPYE